MALAAIQTRETLLLSEVIGAMSYALDLTEGQPPGHCLRCCWIGMHVGTELSLTRAELWDLYYTLLLKDAGCSSNAARLCQMYGSDDRATKYDFKRVDSQNLVEVATFVLKHTAMGKGLRERFQRVVNLARNGESFATELISTRCERGAGVALQLGFTEVVAAGIRGLDEHWNGKGRPSRLHGQEIPVGARIALMAQVADVFNAIGGPEVALAQVRARSGTWFDPEVAAAFERVAQQPGFWQALQDANFPEQVCKMEPAPHVIAVDEDRLDAITEAFGQVVDSKSPYTFGHSARVAAYTDALATQLGLPPSRRRWLRRGAFLHDVGKLGVSNSILDKPGSLTADEWEAVRAHARYTEEILSRIAVFSELAVVAGAHHERLDGKGYPKGLKGNEIILETRIITTADIFDAITAERPYRKAIPVPMALEMMAKTRGEAIDPDCFDTLKIVLPDLHLDPH